MITALRSGPTRRAFKSIPVSHSLSLFPLGEKSIRKDLVMVPWDQTCRGRGYFASFIYLFCLAQFLAHDNVQSHCRTFSSNSRASLRGSGDREEKPNTKRNIRRESLPFKIPRATAQGTRGFFKNNVGCVLTVILPPRGICRKHINAWGSGVYRKEHWTWRPFGQPFFLSHQPSGLLRFSKSKLSVILSPLRFLHVH